MKLVIQIPCFNEETALPGTLRDIPRRIDGVDEVEVVVIDDGSTDGTADAARQNGADHVVCLGVHQGLGRAFMAGVEKALGLGADIIVNTDGDHQYRGADIPALIRPILERKAHMVIGDRQLKRHREFSRIKKCFQFLGNIAVRQISGRDIRDAASGFRAFRREAIEPLNLKTRFSHTLETIVFAAKKGLIVATVPVGTNPAVRPSRLAPNMWSYIKQSAGSLVRIAFLYEPMKICVYLAAPFWCAAALSLLGVLPCREAAARCLLAGAGITGVGILADLIGANIRVCEEQLLLLKRLKG